MGTYPGKSNPEPNHLPMLPGAVPGCDVLYPYKAKDALLYLQRHHTVCHVVDLDLVWVLDETRQRRESDTGTNCVIGLLCVYATGCREYASHVQFCASYRYVCIAICLCNGVNLIHEQK